MNVLDLFSGIGGFSLGLQRAGFTTIGFCEIDPYCRAVLKKHWPEIPCHDDIKTFKPKWRSADIICGGFPCQDISIAGKGAGITGKRSGLWSEYARIIDEIRPHYVIVENVAALLHRGIERVLGDLAEIGYDAEWHCIPASAVGAPHRRDRIWIVGYPSGSTSKRVARSLFRTQAQISSEDWLKHGDMLERPCNAGENVSNANQPRLERRLREILQERTSQWTAGESNPSIPDADSERELQSQRLVKNQRRRPRNGGEDVADTEFEQRDRWRDRTCGWEREPQEALCDARRGERQEAWMSIPESLLGRVAHGIPNRVHRLRSLGNAIVPQVAEIIGQAIMEYESE